MIWESVFSNTIQVNPWSVIEQTNTDAWKLSLIETPLKDSLTFSYIDEEIIPDSLPYKSYIKYGSNQSDTVIAHQIINAEGSYISDKKLISIESKTGKIRFEYNNQFRLDLPSSKNLTGIKAFSKQADDSVLIREFRFYQSYFESCNSIEYCTDTKGRYRLRLDSLKEKNEFDLLPPYMFYYDYGTNRKLPSRFSYAQDIWGFYNGQLTNNSFIPKVYIYPERTGNDRFRYYPVQDPVTGQGFDTEIILDG